MLGMDWWRCGLILRPRTSCTTRIPLNYKLVITNGGVYVLFHFHFLRRFSMSKYSLKSMNYSFRLQLMIRYNSRVHIEVEDTWWGKIGLEKRFLSSGKFDPCVQVIIVVWILYLGWVVVLLKSIWERKTMSGVIFNHCNVWNDFGRNVSGVARIESKHIQTLYLNW